MAKTYFDPRFPKPKHQFTADSDPTKEDNQAKEDNSTKEPNSTKDNNQEDSSF